MKKLEQFMEPLKDKMDFMEPDEGHFGRFQGKLNHRITRPSVWLARVAAAVIFAAIISINLYIFSSGKSETLSTELKETAYFYNQRSESILLEIRNNQKLDNDQKQLILHDIHGFEKEYDSILKDLKKFPGDERIINAFIDYHKSRAEFLEEILNQLNANNLITI